MSNTSDQDTDLEPGIVHDRTKREGLPPGAGTRGDEGDIPGTAGWGTPNADALAGGHVNEPPVDLHGDDGEIER